MNSRVACGVLAIVGGVAVALGSYLPNAESNGFKNRIFETKAPHAILFFAIEPAAVAVAAVVIGILLLVRPPLRLTPGILLGIGVQTVLMFVGYVGYAAQSQYGGTVKAGGWVGMLGGAVIATAGAILLSERDGSPLPAEASEARAGTYAAAQGWYPDPADATLVRYWTGAEWTQHTHPAEPPVVPADLAVPLSPPAQEGDQP